MISTRVACWHNHIPVPQLPLLRLIIPVLLSLRPLLFDVTAFVVGTQYLVDLRQYVTAQSLEFPSHFVATVALYLASDPPSGHVITNNSQLIVCSINLMTGDLALLLHLQCVRNGVGLGMSSCSKLQV